MKKLLLFTISFSFFCTAKGQTTTAYDWTRTDCDGVNHHLFSELDQGNVIVIEFVMMDCVPCVTASKGIKDLVQPYETSHPGKVHIYGVAYTNSYTCEQLNTWKSENAFDYPVFTGGAKSLATTEAWACRLSLS